MEAGKFFIDAQKLDLNKIVPQELEQLKNLATSRGVDLRYTPTKKPVPIMNLDENKTRQVIMNLADNAVHYSAPPKGGGKVEVHLERDGDDIVYVVRDNGIGVPKDQQGKLFTKMFRAKNAQEVRPDGTGLGLYLVKRVVEDQGGKLIFESTPGKGSVFGFRIPIHNKIVVDKTAQKALMSAQQNN
jgi:signal transduction histidine kinase